MKKIFSVIAAVIMMLILGITVYAADYCVDEAGMYISFPVEYDILTPGMDKETYISYGYNDSYNDIMAFLDENAFLLYGISWEGDSYIYVTMIENYGINYASCTEGKLTEEMNKLNASVVVSNGYTGHEKEIAEIGPYKFVKLRYTDSEGYENIIYATAYDRNLIAIEYICSAETYSEDFYEMAKKSAESIVFADLTKSGAENESAAEYYVDELGAYVPVPEKYYVMMTGYTDERLLSEFTEEELAELEAENAANEKYLVLMDESFSHYISIFISPDLDGFGSRAEYFETVKAAYSGSNVEILEEEIIQFGEEEYLRILYNEFSEGYRGSAYFTLRDGKMIAYTLAVSFGELTERLEYELYSMVKNTRFGEKEVPFEETEAFVYTDENLGFSFNVPKNWVREETSDAIEGLGNVSAIYFHSAKNPEQVIIFTGMSMIDFVSDITFGMVEFSGEELDVLTEKEFANAFDLPEESIGRKTFGEVEYMIAETEVSGTKAVYAGTIKNGIYYVFTFMGETEGEFYSDFVSIIESVEYAEAPVPEGSGVPEEAKGIVTTVVIVIAVTGFIVLGGIVAALVFAMKKSGKKKEAEKVFPPEENIEKAPEKIICPSCGAEIEAGNSFCTNCGAKL
ncbi:MAG: zinc-ribbon domain-containing protein [Ruminococcaceae bacterium]|nr:zinc-ribbon domain-containing protein [Oscillospiraceae bacterium]